MSKGLKGLIGGGLLSVGLLFGTAGAARAADTPYDPRGGRDQEIITQLHQRNQDLIAAARVAEDRASRGDVKDYAARVIADRQAADARLMAYAQEQGMNIPEIQTSAGALPHGPLAVARLTNVSADRFGPYFAADMAAREQAAVDEATRAQNISQGPRLTDLIRDDVLPTLRDEQAGAVSLTAALPPLQTPAVQQPGEPAVASWALPNAPR